MVHACASVVPADENPGVILGAILGTAQKNGRDKLTIVTSPGIYDLRRVARAVDRRIHRKRRQGPHPGRPRAARPRRMSMATTACSPTCASPAHPIRSRTLQSTRSKRPAIRSSASPCRDIYDLGQEFFRWEIATAVAGSIIGINAFNQPDVEASKIETRKLTDAIRGKRARCRPNPPFCRRRASSSSPTRRMRPR